MTNQNGDSDMRKVKHNKIRNTGLLFEFLLRQITSDVLNKNIKELYLYMNNYIYSDQLKWGLKHA